MRLDNIITREGFPQLKFLNLNFLITQFGPWSWIVRENRAIGRNAKNDEDDESEDEFRPQPTLEEFEAQHLSHLKMVKAINGLEVTYSSTLHVVTL